jgi:predicted XRE-type DNA-binding protein
MSSNRAGMQIVSGGETANARALKDSLSAELAAWIRSECRDTSDAAKRLGITTERVSDLLDSRYANFTIDALVESLLRAGKKVQLHVR